MDQIPLLSIQSFTDFSPESFLTYVKGLYIDPKAGKKASSDLNFRFNKKGTAIITIRNRKPKWISPKEIDELADDAGLERRKMWVIVGEKGIPVSRTKVAVKL